MTVRKGRAIRVHFEATNETYTMSHYDVASEGWRMHPGQGDTVVDAAFLHVYPEVVSKDK